MGSRLLILAAGIQWALYLVAALQLVQGARLLHALHRVSPYRVTFVSPFALSATSPTKSATVLAKQSGIYAKVYSAASGNAGDAYPFNEVERSWVNYYAQKSAEFSPPLPPCYNATEANSQGEGDIFSGSKFYVLSMIPYPSGTGLHMGHCYTYTLSDVVARYQRLRLRARAQRQQVQQSQAAMCGADTQQKRGTEETERPLQPNVLHAIGWDSFGLPAEQHARDRGEAPASVVSANVNTFRQQLQRLGISVDWRREITTSHPEFFRWTQWAFLQMLKRGLAYEADAEVNWCPALGTVLANEELTADGLSERGRFPVERRRLRQWHLKLRAYAERLLDGLSSIDWPSDVLRMQRNWIGRGEYLRLKLEMETRGAPLSCLLLAPEYVFGCMGVVLHPRHPLVGSLGPTREEKERIESYLNSRKRDSPRHQETTGVHSGVYVHHPVTRQKLPVIISDIMENLPEFGYQLSEADALLVSPSHEPFAAQLAAAGLVSLAPVTTRRISQREGMHPQMAAGKIEERKETTEREVVVNSCSPSLNLNGKRLEDAREMAVRWLTANGRGETDIRYRLKDWVFSRQRYWGEPIPVLRVSGERQNNGQEGAGGGAGERRAGKEEEHLDVLPLSEDALPLTLPPFHPELTGSPMASAAAVPTAAVASEVSPGKETERNEKGCRSNASKGPEPIAALDRYTDWVCRASPASGEKREEGTCGGLLLRRETCTMPQWAGSSWYYLRFIDPHNQAALARMPLLRYWLPVDLYVGGKEHAVTHLIYARFWHKMLADIGAACEEEPFKRLVTPGVILGAPRHFLLRRTDTRAPVSAADADLSPAAVASLTSPAAAEDATAQAGCGVHRPSGVAVYAEPLSPDSPLVRQRTVGTWVFSPQTREEKTTRDSLSPVAAAATGPALRPSQEGKDDIQLLTVCEKMSKSRGNAVSPDSIFNTHGADALRIHLMALGPVATTKVWRDEGLSGASRLLRRTWKMFLSPVDAPYMLPSGPQGARDGSTEASPQALRGIADKPISEGERRLLSTLVVSVTQGLERMQVNKAVAALMQGTRQLQEQQQQQGGTLSVSAARTLLTLLHPLAPFITEELWARLSAAHPTALRYPGWSLAASGEWPEVDAKKGGQHKDGDRDIGHEEVDISVQLDGRHRLCIPVAKDDIGSTEALLKAVRGTPQVQQRLKREEDKGRLLNMIIAKPEARFINFVFT